MTLSYNLKMNRNSDVGIAYRDKLKCANPSLGTNAIDHEDILLCSTCNIGVDHASDITIIKMSFEFYSPYIFI